MKSNIEQGEIGEQMAITYLIKKGFNLLEKNWRNSTGEIDLIMSKDNIIVFVEVKLRKTDTFGDPEKAVSKSKQKRIIQTANSYIFDKNIPERFEYRFDIISIVKNNNFLSIKHFEDAFWL